MVKKRISKTEQRKLNKEKQDKRKLKLKQQNIKQVIIEVHQQDIDKLVKATGLVQKRALTKCVEIGVQSLTQSSCIDDGFSQLTYREDKTERELINKVEALQQLLDDKLSQIYAKSDKTENQPVPETQVNHASTQCIEVIKELNHEVQTAIETAQANGKNWHNNRVLTSKRDIIQRFANTLNLDLDNI